jgi:hypothetical protein
VHLYIHMLSQNKERILPHTTFIYTIYSRDRERLQRGTNWIFKYNKLFCVLKALKSEKAVHLA